MMVSTLHGQFQEYESKSYEKPSNLHFGGTTIRSWPLFSFLHDLGFWDGLGVTVGGWVGLWVVVARWAAVASWLLLKFSLQFVI